MNSERRCYSVDQAGYAYGPYRSEVQAEERGGPGETIMWLDPYEDIDQFRYIKTQEDTK